MVEGCACRCTLIVITNYTPSHGESMTLSLELTHSFKQSNEPAPGKREEDLPRQTPSLPLGLRGHRQPYRMCNQHTQGYPGHCLVAIAPMCMASHWPDLSPTNRVGGVHAQHKIAGVRIWFFSGVGMCRGAGSGFGLGPGTRFGRERTA